LCTHGEDETIVIDFEFFCFARVALANDGDTGEGVGFGIDFGCGCFEVAYFAVDLCRDEFVDKKGYEIT